MTNEELKKIYFGAYSFEETDDGYLQAFQYSEKQMEYFKDVSFDVWYDRCMASSAKTLEFITEAVEISFDYKFLWIGSQDTIEVAVNGLIADITYVKDMAEEGTICWKLQEGEKNVIIYLPADATVVIKNFTADAPCKRAEKTEKVLWL